MGSENLGAYYDRWNKLCNDLSDDEDDEARPLPARSGKPMIDPKDISVSFGTPMSEEEFKSRHKGMVPSAKCDLTPNRRHR